MLTCLQSVIRNGDGELSVAPQEQSKNENTLCGESGKIKSAVLKIGRIEKQRIILGR